MVFRSLLKARSHVARFRTQHIPCFTMACTCSTTTPSDASGNPDPPVRFFDSREKYLLFCNTTDEKWRCADHLIKELEHLKPKPPSLNIFDAGLGDASVLCKVLRGAHGRYPTIPFVVVGKEISLEDVRLSLSKMPDRFSEHPNLVVCVTNMFYKEAPGLMPLSPKMAKKMQWVDMPLRGTTAIEFERQIESELTSRVSDAWEVVHGKGGNPKYAKPSVLCVYREDQRFNLHGVLPHLEWSGLPFQSEPVIRDAPQKYDLMIASQPFSARASAKKKVANVLLPMSKALKEDGRLVVVQSTGHDPGMEIVNKVWPDENPFRTPRHMLMDELKQQLKAEGLDHHAYHFSENNMFNYRLHSLPDAGAESIGTSAILAAWNAASYVAQVDDQRVDTAMREGAFIKPTQEVLAKYGDLWFVNEKFVISRKGSSEVS